MQGAVCIWAPRRRVSLDLELLHFLRHGDRVVEECSKAVQFRGHDLSVVLFCGGVSKFRGSTPLADKPKTKNSAINTLSRIRL